MLLSCDDVSKEIDTFKRSNNTLLDSLPVLKNPSLDLHKSSKYFTHVLNRIRSLVQQLEDLKDIKNRYDYASETRMQDFVPYYHMYLYNYKKEFFSKIVDRRVFSSRIDSYHNYREWITETRYELNIDKYMKIVSEYETKIKQQVNLLLQDNESREIIEQILIKEVALEKVSCSISNLNKQQQIINNFYKENNTSQRFLLEHYD